MNEEEIQELIEARNKGKKKDLIVRESDGILMQENRMYVPNDVELKKAILTMHTVQLMRFIQEVLRCIIPFNRFIIERVWKKEIAEYVSRRIICQQVKVERKKPFGLMRSLPVPQWKWENIAMDFVYKFPRIQNGYDGI
ncbi:hypothetical protein PS2_000711 [Malus domestica]|uniref:uncharacterized protein n=1 Tax=Malus domestica TaxID=3750 RepID=UPI0039770515